MPTPIVHQELIPTQWHFEAATDAKFASATIELKENGTYSAYVNWTQSEDGESNNYEGFKSLEAAQQYILDELADE